MLLLLAGRIKAIWVKDRESNETSVVQAYMVVNAAGLYAQSLAKKLQGLPSQSIPEAFLARGHYCTMEGAVLLQCTALQTSSLQEMHLNPAVDHISALLALFCKQLIRVAHYILLFCSQLVKYAGKPPFKRLIYPMPETWGLGVHLTLDLEGRARFGPDVEWIDKVEYNTSPELCDKFYPVIRQYWPGLPDGSLRPSYSGIRPKASSTPKCDCSSISLLTLMSVSMHTDSGKAVVALLCIQSSF